MRWNLWLALSLVSVAAGVLFYLYMGATYGNWGDVGVYTFAIVPIGFGAFGAWTAMNLPEPVEE